MKRPLVKTLANADQGSRRSHSYSMSKIMARALAKALANDRAFVRLMRPYKA